MKLVNSPTDTPPARGDEPSRGELLCGGLLILFIVFVIAMAILASNPIH